MTPLPEPTSLLAIARYLQGELTEGKLAGELGLDRLDARARVAEFLDTAIAHASVPVERISTLEARLATATHRASQLNLLHADALAALVAEQDKNHDLRNHMARLTLQAEELQLDLDAALRDLAAERQHLAEMAREQAERGASMK